MIEIKPNSMQTRYGQFDLHNLTTNDINIKDIAHSLSNICRFNGHTKKFYSVATHCCMVCDMIMEDLQNPLLALHGLLHDAHEAYVQDMTRPLKYFLKDYHNIDISGLLDAVDATIYSAIGLNAPSEKDHKTIKHYDHIALFSEKDCLFDNSDWGWTYESKDLDYMVYYLDKNLSWDEEFMDRFNNLKIDIMREFLKNAKITGDYSRVISFNNGK